MRTLIALALSLPAHAATVTVGPSGQHTTIQAAVSAANAGDTLQIAAGTYTGPIVVNKDIDLYGIGGVTIEGANASVVQIDQADVTLGNIDIHPNGGRGVRIDGGTVALLNVRVSGNQTGNLAYNGAGIAIFGGIVTLTNVELSDNEVRSVFTPFRVEGFGAHMYVDGATVTLDGCTLTDGEARSGGAIYALNSSLQIDGTTLQRHSASFTGGAIYLQDTSLTFTSSQIHDATAGSHGGGVYVENDDEAVDLVDASISSASTSFGGNGGGIYLDASGPLTLTDVRMANNDADGDGGGVHSDDSAAITVNRSRWCGNAAGRHGGAISAKAGGVVVQQTLFVGNTTNNRGGAVYQPSGSLTVTFSDILSNSSGSQGPALYATGAGLTLRHTLVADHSKAALHASSGTLDYNAWFANIGSDTAGGVQIGSHAVTADPLMAAYSAAQGCDAELRRAPTSPLRDAGDPAILDPDGTTADIGIWGGPGADPALFVDHDNDGDAALYDCNDGDQATHSGALELCNGIDNDCDGIIDGPNPANSTTWYIDLDGDGAGVDETAVTQCSAPEHGVSTGGDCDDTNDEISPFAIEICDRIDNNCDGSTDGPDAKNKTSWYEDSDGDGYGGGAGIQACTNPGNHVPNPFDCDDTDPDISPVAEEICDGLDRNCDGAVDGPDPVDGLPFYPDADGDGFGDVDGRATIACLRPNGYARDADDCDDNNDTIHPRAEESCDAPLIDSNCDGKVGRGDDDRDGFAACDDCDDGDASFFPGAPNTWYDGVVQDCDLLSDFDQDGDGYESDEFGGTDCLDTDPDVHPGAKEVLSNGIDDDCVDGDQQGVPRGTCGGCAQGGAAPWSVWMFGVVWMLRRRNR